MLRTRPSTQGDRDAQAERGRLRMAAIVDAAGSRGWVGCGDLLTKADRRLAAFKRSPEWQRFALSYVVSPSGCWDWVGAKKPSGYGQFRFHAANWNAHRAAYVLIVAPIPEGMTLDHLCRNKGCVNPAHLEPVTQAENTRRFGETFKACPQGHPYDEANTLRKHSGRRSCRACHNERTGLRYAAKQAKAQAVRPGGIRLLDEDVDRMRAMRADGVAVKAIAELFGVSAKYASAVITGSRKRRRSHTGPDAATLKLLAARSGDRCEFSGCTELAAHTHHRKPRRLGGTRDLIINLPPNLIRLCVGHHEWVESNRREALGLGLLLHASDDPARTHVALRGDLVYLTADGAYSDNPPVVTA